MELFLRFERFGVEFHDVYALLTQSRTYRRTWLLLTAATCSLT